MTDQAATPDEAPAISPVTDLPPDLALRGDLMAGLRNWGVERVHAIVGEAINRWLVEDHDFGATVDKQPRYPYEEGDVLVLGPQVFIGEGGVINYQGENYVPQNVPTDELPSEDQA